MFKIMYDTEGAGLAAPQIGINKRLMVFNSRGDKKYKYKEMVLVNPVLTVLSNEMEEDEESCLSLPGVSGLVQRYNHVSVTYQTVTGEQKQREFSEYEARVFQHEYDHLDGVRIVLHCILFFIVLLSSVSMFGIHSYRYFSHYLVFFFVLFQFIPYHLLVLGLVHR